MKENLVDRNRIFPALYIAAFTTFFYIFDFNYFFILMLLIFTNYDFLKSKIISFKEVLFFYLFFSIILIFYYKYSLSVYILLYLSVILFFLSLLIKKFSNYIFIFLINLSIFLILILINYEKKIFFLIILASFLNDTIAYIVGRSFKGPLIVPLISPNKTWSGTLSSMILSFFMLNYFFSNFFLSLLISISFFFSDIYFSYFKRIYSIKDFSKLLQGHGGFLDRFDSLFLPVIIICFFYL